MGPIVGGILITSGISHPLLFLVAACPMVVCAISIVFLQRAKAAAQSADARLKPAAAASQGA